MKTMSDTTAGQWPAEALCCARCLAPALPSPGGGFKHAEAADAAECARLAAVRPVFLTIVAEAGRADASGLCTCMYCGPCWRGGDGPDGLCTPCRDGAHGSGGGQVRS